MAELLTIHQLVTFIQQRIVSERMTFVAIDGPSGAGKSTVIKLIMRLYEPGGGTIRIDGVAIDGYRFDSLRAQITPVSQDALLLRQSIGDNISFGKPEATIEEIMDAARSAGADEFIRDLPDGYDTLIGEGGQTLSGGQRQRIAFARAVLRDSRIMIFDEPANGLDAASEGVVREALEFLKADRSVLLITHQLNLVASADHVLFLEEGEVVEQGDIETLMASRGRFWTFYQEWLSRAGGQDSLPVTSASAGHRVP